MKITKLTLENFRSFKEKQTIEFAPVTLLFGPNSVGKSTVLLALFYIRHILSKGDCNPLHIEELGNKYIGGFRGLVHGRDLKRTIRIGVEYSKGNSIGSSYRELRDLLGEGEFEELEWLFELPDASGTVEHVGVDFSINWSTQRNLAYISQCVIKLDKEEFATLKSSTGGEQAFIESINYLHPLLVGDEHDDWLIELFDAGAPIHPENFNRVVELKEVDNSSAEMDEGHLSLPKITTSWFVSFFHFTLTGNSIPEQMDLNDRRLLTVANQTKFLHDPIYFRNEIGAVPVLKRGLDTTLDFADRKKLALLIEVLSDAIVPVFDNLLIFLEDSLCIGPLRSIPDPTYQPNPFPKSKDWHSGLAAWDYLEKADIPFLLKVDYWMREKLALGYGVSNKFQKSFTEYKKLSPSVQSKQTEAKLDSLIVESLTNTSSGIECNEVTYLQKYALWDSDNQIDVSACDIGVGVSQILPFIVAALANDRGFVAIEQPELHVHPRVQVGIGDLLTQANRNVGFLVETHSEHLILRLLKRIRQTTDGELPEGVKPVFKEDVSIVYLETSHSGVKAKRIHLDEGGEFQQRWPDGFFAERREELL